MDSEVVGSNVMSMHWKLGDNLYIVIPTSRELLYVLTTSLQ